MLAFARIGLLDRKFQSPPVRPERFDVGSSKPALDVGRVDQRGSAGASRADEQTEIVAPGFRLTFSADQGLLIRGHVEQCRPPVGFEQRS
jgi:hypothetical protein